MLTVRQRVGDIQRELLTGDVLPARARELLMILTSLFGNCVVEVTARKAAYVAVLAQCLDDEQKANRARIRAELSPEHGAWEVARDTEAIVVELIRTLKTVLKSIEEECRLAR